MQPLKKKVYDSVSDFIINILIKNNFVGSF